MRHKTRVYVVLSFFLFTAHVTCQRAHELTTVDVEGSSEMFKAILRVKILSAGAPERRDSEPTPLLTRQISLSGLSGRDYAEE